MYTNKKPIIMAISVLVFGMVVGYALLSQNLTINGTSHIDSNWNIRITNIEVQDVHSAYQSGSNASADVSGSTGCTTQTASSNGCGTTEANFETKLVTPGDYVIYRVTITNSGTLDGVVESINLACSENDAIICTTTGLSRAATIAKNGGTNTVDVKVEYNSATTTQPANTNSTATLTINYQQNLGQIDVSHDFNGTGTIYRYRTGNADTQILSLNQNIESYLENDSYLTEWSTTPTTFNSINYLKHDVENYIITASYACFIADNTEHCMQGGNSSYYYTNAGVLQGVRSWFTSNSGSCSIDSSGSVSHCSGAGFSNVSADSDGYVHASAAGVQCTVDDEGDSYCTH